MAENAPHLSPGTGGSPLPGGRPPRLRVTRPAARASLRTRVARASRVLHGWLVCAVAIQVTLATAPSSLSLPRRVAAGLVVSAAFLVSFRIERRSGTFARLSELAQGIYRLRAVVGGAFAMGAVAFWFPELGVTPRMVVTTAAALVIVSGGWGFITRQLLHGTIVRRVLFVGDGIRVQHFVDEFATDPHPGFQIAGALTEQRDEHLVAALKALVGRDDPAPCLGTLDDLESVLAAEAIDIVVPAVSHGRLELFARLSSWPGEVTVQELPAFSEHVFGRVPVDDINAAWFMHMIHPFFRAYSAGAKRIADVVASLVILIAALPILPIAALLVKLTSRGPVLYSQLRVGEHGREFRIYKFRTMVENAEEDGPQWAEENDPRTTPVGAFLRETRIDELPQLWNILRGTMSFVGPRPERPEFVVELEQAVPYYQRRHMVKPGLTGWAQVRLGYSDTIDGAARKLGYELYYLKHRSLLLDLVIFVETIRVVLLRFGSR